MKKKVLALVLMLVVLASVLTVPAAAAGGKTFPDAKGHWAEESIMRWSRCGLVNGDDLGNVNPNKPLRRCEMATILSNMLGLRTAAPVSTFRDINGTEWYARAILRCAAAGIMQGSNDSMSLPEDYITREEAITMFCRALNVPRDDDPDLSKFSDGDKVSGWAAPYLTTLTELGILSGMGDGSVAPHDYINRAGAFTLMDKAISVYANAPGNYTSQNGNGFVVINANTYQAGDVIVSGKAVGVLVSVSTTDTVRLRDLSAENVDINGKGSVIIGGKSSLDNVEAHTEIEMTVEANATVDTLDINSEKITLTNAGTVKNLNCDKVATVTNSGKVENLVADAAISITNTGTVDKLVANAGITVDNNKGTIKNAEINKGGVVMDGAPQQMTVATGVARPNNSGGRPVSASGAVSTPSNSGKNPSTPAKPTVAVESVSLKNDSWALKVGESVELKATVEPESATNKTLTWASSEPTVATVGTNGKVTALKEGEALITVSSSNGRENYCAITVLSENTETIPLKDLWTLPSGAELDEGDTLQLELYLLPNNATVVKDSIKWESQYPSIATVSDTGLVTAMSKGTTEIVVSITVPIVDPSEEETGGSGSTGGVGGSSSAPSTSGGSASGGNTDVSMQEDEETETATTRTATCKITVRPKTVTPVPAASVTISGNPDSVKVNDIITLTANVEPTDATDTVTWEVTEGKDVLEITEGQGTKTIKVKALKDGPATIKVTAGKESDSIKLTVEKDDDNPPTQEHKVALSQTSLTFILKDGYAEPQTLTVTVDDVATTETVTWGSDDKAVATVEDGVVTAVGKGTTSITAKVTIDGEERTLTCVVEVKEENGETPSVPQVNGVTINGAPIGEVEVGTPVTLSVTIEADEGANTDVTWTVTVEDGNESDFSISENLHATSITVTATQPGRVTIKVASDENSEVFNTCTITFQQSPLTVKAVAVTPGELDLKIENDVGGNGELTATVTMSDNNPDATQTVTWSVTDKDDNEFAAGEAVVMITPDTEDSQKVTVKALKPGTAKVVASCGGQSGHCIVAVKEVKPEYDLAVTVNNEEESGITLTAPENGEGQVVISATIVTEVEEAEISWAATDTSNQNADGTIVNLTPGENNSCTVEAITEGTVTITVRYGESSVTCTITITITEKTSTTD